MTDAIEKTWNSDEEPQQENPRQGEKGKMEYKVKKITGICNSNKTLTMLVANV